MESRWGHPIEYSLPFGEDKLPMNKCIGKEVSLHFTGRINCLKCGKSTKKSFNQGFCWNCFQNAPEASPCIIRPELCEAHLGKGRDAEWEKENHYQPHVVYLALSSAVKVGVTRLDQIPTRWIDQGAHSALVISQIPYRQLAGQIEVALKEHFTDKTNWRKMLTNQIKEGSDLILEKNKALAVLPSELAKYKEEKNEVIELPFPVVEYPEKVKSINLDKDPDYSGILTGIRGQYLLFKGGDVINIRKYGGYFLEITVS